MKLKLTILSLILILITTTGFGCKSGSQEAQQALLKKVELNVWGIYDSSDSLNKIISAYQKIHPNIKINYSKINWQEYEKKMLEAWSEGTGPDIFLVNNTWVEKYKNRISPMPAKIQLPAVEISGTLKKEQKAIIKETLAPTSEDIKTLFPDVVFNDTVKDNSIYGLPLSIDTLALFYNRQHFNAAGITSPPVTWQEVSEDIKKLTLQNSSGEIVRSGISLGGATNINRSNDILSLLMLQNGTTMVSGKNNISFDEKSIYDSAYYPGRAALQFYTDFGLPSKEVYTWNSDLLESLDAFYAGQLSMLLGYSYYTSLIQAQAPNIDFAVSEVPHINADKTDAFGLPINFANYWLYTVYNNTPNKNEAWDFIIFMTTSKYKTEEGEIRYYAQDYLDSTNRPPALKALINTYTEQPLLRPFVNQLLTAQSWYRGNNPNHMETTFKQMIENVITGQSTIKDAINFAVRSIQQTY